MYVKLFGSILDSSIWSEDHATRLVWITMLAMADEAGSVQAAIPGLARRAGVTRTECEHALKVLTSPDKDSRSEEFEGRRIEKLAGGWQLLNYQKYREIRTREQMQSAMRMRKYRKRNSDVSNATGSVTQAPLRTEVEVEGEVERKENLPVAPTALGVGVTARKPGGRNGRLPARRYDEITAKITALFAETAERGERTMQDDELRELQADMVFAYWAARLNHKGAFLDAKRVNLLKAALKLNRGNVHELLYVVDGTLKDDYLMGRSANSRTKYDGLETIFRDRGQIEKLAAKGGYRDGGTHPQADKYEALVHE